MKIDTVIGYCLILLGVGAIFYVGSFHYKAGDVTTWEKKDVEITHSEVGKYPDGTGKRASNQFYPIIKFKYSSNGKTFTSDKYALRTMDDHKREVEKIISKYKVGKKVKAFVNKKNPSEAYLTDKIGSINMMLTIPCFTFLLGTLAIMKGRKK